MTTESPREFFCAARHTDCKQDENQYTACQPIVRATLSQQQRRSQLSAAFKALRAAGWHYAGLSCPWAV
jgi:hypothetical protein